MRYCKCIGESSHNITSREYFRISVKQQYCTILVCTVYITKQELQQPKPHTRKLHTCIGVLVLVVHLYCTLVQLEQIENLHNGNSKKSKRMRLLELCKISYIVYILYKLFYFRMCISYIIYFIVYVSYINFKSYMYRILSILVLELQLNQI